MCCRYGKPHKPAGHSLALGLFKLLASSVPRMVQGLLAIHIGGSAILLGGYTHLRKLSDACAVRDIVEICLQVSDKTVTMLVDAEAKAVLSFSFHATKIQRPPRRQGCSYAARRT